MSWNNVMPTWMFGEFNEYHNQMVRKEITIKEFCDKIEPLKEVPETVKQNWINISEEHEFFNHSIFD